MLQMGPFGEPMGTWRGPESTKTHRKRRLESRPLKSDKKVPNMDPQNLKNLNMAAEGHQFSLIPPTSPKSSKSHQNSSQMSSKSTAGLEKTLKRGAQEADRPKEGSRRRGSAMGEACSLKAPAPGTPVIYIYIYIYI